eukprot:sb/3468606/
MPDKRFTDNLKVSGASLDPDSGSDGGEILPADSEVLETVGELAGENLLADSVECIEEKRVSFNEAICPLIDVISSTPCPVYRPSQPCPLSEYSIPLEKHDSIKRKFNEIIDSRFIRIPQYNDQYLVLRSPSTDDNSLSGNDRPPVFFLRMDCYHEHLSTPVSSLPTCVLEVLTGDEKKKREMEFCFTCYTVPSSVHVSPAAVVRSPASAVRHRRRDSHRKSEGDRRSSERTTSFSAHQLSRSLHEDYKSYRYRK